MQYLQRNKLQRKIEKSQGNSLASQMCGVPPQGFAKKSEKNIKQFSIEYQKGRFWTESGKFDQFGPDLGHFGPNEKFH